MSKIILDLVIGTARAVDFDDNNVATGSSRLMSAQDKLKLDALSAVNDAKLFVKFTAEIPIV